MKTTLLIAVLCLTALGCTTRQSTEQTATAPTTGEVASANEAIAQIEGRSDTNTDGQAHFTESDGKVTMHLTVKNLKAGRHAAHIHEKGDCSAPDASSAGPHWNPTTEPHGKWGEGEHHHGDIGNIDVAEDGTGSLTLATDQWTLGTGAANDVVGKAVVVHADPDDFTSQPAGNAGGRVGCGVIKMK